MAKTRFERLFSPLLLELRLELYRKLRFEHAHDQAIIEKELARLALIDNFYELGRRKKDWHTASEMHSLVYSLVVGALKSVSKKDFTPVISPVAQKVWILFLRYLFGRGSWPKAEAVARLLLYTMVQFLRRTSLTKEEHAEILHYYAHTCSIENFYEMAFYDELEEEFFVAFQELGIPFERKYFTSTSLAGEAWSIFRRLLRKYRWSVHRVSPTKLLLSPDRQRWSNVARS